MSRRLKKHLRSIISLVLLTVVATQNPLNVLAESMQGVTVDGLNKEKPTEKPTEYVKEIITSYSTNENQAKKRLTDKDFQVVDNDLNPKTKEDFVFMGYKTTTNKNEALTDISMMDMSGGYSSLDYRTVADTNSENVNQMAVEMMQACAEMSDNVVSGSPSAVLGKRILDLLQVAEDDDQPLGDYLLSTDRKIGDYYNIILMSNSIILSYIYNQLVLGTADNNVDDTWMNRLSEIGQINSEEEIEELDEQAYDVKADKLYNSIYTFSKGYKDALSRTKDNGGQIEESTVSSEKEANEEAQDLVDGKEVEDSNADQLYISAYKVLQGYTYGDSNLGEYFVKAGEDGADHTLLYPLIKSLTGGQYATMRISGVLNQIIASNNTEEACSKSDEEFTEKQEALEKIGEGKVNLWTGSTKELFDGELTITDEASRVAASSANYDFLNQKSSLDEKLELTLMWAGGIGLVALGVGIIVLAGFSIAFGVGIVTVGAAMMGSFTATIGSAIAAICGLGPIAIAVVVAVVVLVVAVWYGVRSILSWYDYYHPDYKTIPMEMYDVKGSNYIKYNVALDHKGNAGDLNAWEGKEWNAMYTTTDPRAGKPIKVNELGDTFKIKRDDPEIPKGYGSMNFFGEVVPANANSHVYHDEKSVYLYYYLGDNSNTDSKQENKTEEITDDKTREETADNASDSVENSDTSDKVGNEKIYLSDIKLVSSENADSAKNELKKQGYTLIDYNLTCDQSKRSYIGYKTTKYESEALRDIRVAYNTCVDTYVWGNATYARAGSCNDITLYYSQFKQVGTPILADLKVCGDMSEAPVGYEPVNLFSGGDAFDISYYMWEKSDSWKKKSYIYFHPSVEYTSGTQYVSGFNYVTGHDEEGITLEEYADSLGSAYKQIEVCKRRQGKTYEYLRMTVTYNPYRAITGIHTLESEANAGGLNGNITNNGIGHSACETYTQGGGTYYGYFIFFDWTDAYHVIRKSHAYENYNRDEGTRCGDDGVGNKAIYVCGPQSGVDPIVADEVIFTNENTIPDGYIPACNILDEFSTEADNVATYEEYNTNSGTELYMFYKGKPKEKKKYIKSVKVVYSGMDDYSSDICVYSLLASGGDEILPINLATREAISNSESYRPNSTNPKGLNSSYKDKTAYLRVTRTSKKSEALRGMMIYNTDDGDPNDKISINDVEWNKAGDKVDGRKKDFYIFTSINTTVGNPIKEVSFDDNPIKSGAYTAFDQNGDDYYYARWYLHCEYEKKSTEKYIGDIIVSSRDDNHDARAHITRSKFTNYIPFDFNSGANGEYCYIGYNYTKTASNAITKLIVSRQNKETIEVDGVQYTRVGYDSLNEDTDGTDIYLYYTKDKRFGNGIKKLSGSFDSQLPNDEDIWDYVTDDNYETANLNEGVGRPCYLFQDVDGKKTINKYVTDIIVSSRDKKDNAIDNIYDNNFTNYIDFDFNKGAGGEYCYLGYKNTIDSSKAITNMIVSTDNKEIIIVDGVQYTRVGYDTLNEDTNGTDIYLYYTRDKRAGKGIQSISGSSDKKLPANTDAWDYVRNENGNIANINEGVGHECFLFQSKMK